MASAKIVIRLQFVQKTRGAAKHQHAKHDRKSKKMDRARHVLITRSSQKIAKTARYQNVAKRRKYRKKDPVWLAKLLKQRQQIRNLMSNDQMNMNSMTNDYVPPNQIRGQMNKLKGSSRDMTQASVNQPVKASRIVQAQELDEDEFMDLD